MSKKGIAMLEKRIVGIARRWAKTGKGWLYGANAKVTDCEQAERMEDAVADLEEAIRKARRK